MVLDRSCGTKDDDADDDDSPSADNGPDKEVGEDRWTCSAFPSRSCCSRCKPVIAAVHSQTEYRSLFLTRFYSAVKLEDSM